jgi:phosphohistidine phosphatase
MITLLLLRHLKSSWDDPNLADHDRPLNARGRAAGRLVGAHLAGLRRKPSFVLCSTAVRARETLDLMRGALGAGVAVEMDRELYLAGTPRILARLRAIEPEHETVLVIGHNPDLQTLALMLAAEGEGDALRRLRAKFPTGGLATLVGTGPWSGLHPRDLHLAGLVTPKDLATSHGS